MRAVLALTLAGSILTACGPSHPKTTADTQTPGDHQACADVIHQVDLFNAVVGGTTQAVGAQAEKAAIAIDADANKTEGATTAGMTRIASFFNTIATTLSSDGDTSTVTGEEQDFASFIHTTCPVEAAAAPTTSAG